MARLQAVFDKLFGVEYLTRLQGGNDEPFYQAAREKDGYSVIFYTKDYFSSALHEIAHWCVAGAQRRKIDDYGYWYEPDGRSSKQQAVFEKVEVVPQAMERIFSTAAGQAFRVSADNLDGACSASEAFCRNIHQQTLYYCEQGLPARANAFAHALAVEFAQDNPLQAKLYTVEQLV